MKKRLAIPLVIALVFIGVYFVIRQALLENARDQLVDNPKPFPEFIVSVWPWGKMEWPLFPNQQDDICVIFDARALYPLITNVEEMSQYEPMQRIHLYLNDESIGDESEFYVAKPDKGQTAIDFCGHVKSILQGSYLAKITIHSNVSGTLSYEWAFKMVRYPFATGTSPAPSTAQP